MSLRRQYVHTCAQCGAEFHPDGRTNRFCSRLCFTTNRKLNHPRKPCEQCGRPVNDLSPLRRFCSRLCSDRARTQPRPHCVVCGVEVGLGASTCIRHHHTPKRDARRRTCVQCGKEYTPYPSQLSRGNRYCSFDCYRAVTAQRPALLSVTCLNCGATFKRTAAAIKRVNRTYCSLACMAKGQSRENSPAWRGGHDSNRGPYWRAIAAEARERDGNRCRMCGKTEAENGQRLSVDHIIPWRAFTDSTEANDLANLASLCRSCHGKKARAENNWLRGDVLDMWRYQIAVSEPWRAA